MILLIGYATAMIAAGGDEGAVKGTGETVFREPFTVKLQTDKEHFFEQKFVKMPFVHDGDVFLFRGDEFGLNLDIQGDAVRAVTYQPDLKRADVTLKFSQEVRPDGGVMMMLAIHNGVKHKLLIDAMMSLPGKEGVVKTSILPIEAGLADFESWNDPIVVLVLRNIRLGK